MLISTHLLTWLCIENIRYNILDVSNCTLIWSTKRRCHCARSLYALPARTNFDLFIWFISAKKFVYLLEIVDHICCFFVGWGLGHVKSLRFLYYRVDFFNHLIIILPVLGHWQKLYFFSALWKRGKKTLHFRPFSETIADSPLLLTSLLFIPEVGYYKLGVCPAMRRGGGGMGLWDWGS